ncbi:MAG: peptide deformylase [Candidatus Aminicenantes bacterium]|nr:peptide deformylase [Candidatus Aminicenantes bacterium]
MAVRKILTIGHPILTKVAEPITEIDDEIRALAADMVETMHKAPGLGLAAPQVDVSKRLITVDPSIGENPEELLVLINPEITDQEGQVTCEEGCLSVPDVSEPVTRPTRVVVSFLDLKGVPCSVEGFDLMARALCHEIDHLNGKLFIERLSPLKRALIKKKLKKKRDKDGER